MDLNPATGTQIRIARCHEHEGKLALAWADYQAALTLNRSLQGQTEERANELRALAEKELSALAPRVPKLHVVVRDPPPALRLQRDGHDLPVATLGEDLPVDPGTIEIVAEAPSFVTVRRQVVAVEGRVTTVEIALERVAAAKGAPRVDRVDGAPPPSTPKHHGLGGRRIAGITVGSAGVALLGVALGLGVYAFNQASAAAPNCTMDNMCTQPGFDHLGRAHYSGIGSLVTLGFGAAFTVTGITLIVTAPASSGTR
jgi:hypothetical protein